MILPQVHCCSLLILLTIFWRSGAQFTAPSPTCPGQEAVFRCTVVDNSGVSITAFRVNGDAAGQCMVSQSTVDPVTCGPDGEFTAALESISGNTYTSNLTVNATDGLNGTSVQCLNSGVDPAASPLLVIAKPMLPDEVRQNRTQDKEDNTTVIIWQPVIVDGDPGNIITYSITSELGVPSTTSTNTTVTLPTLNTNYTFCVADDATNICGARSDAQKCATPPVIIEAEGPEITHFMTELICAERDFNITASWTVNTDRNGNILRPDVTSLIVKCNSIPDMLTTTANTFTFTNASCVGATEATIEVTATNVVNSSSVMDIISPINRTPLMSHELLIISDAGSVCIKLNTNCMESPLFEGFTAMMVSSEGSKISVNGEIITDCERGPGFLFKSLSPANVRVVISFGGGDIQTLVNITLMKGPPGNDIVPAAAGGGGGGGFFILIVVPTCSNVIIHALFVFKWNYLYFFACAGCCHSGTRKRVHCLIAFFVFLFYITPVTTIILICYLYYCNSKGVPGDDEDSHLKEGTLSHEQELPTYQDPGEIKRQAAPDSQDVYTVPEKKPKKKKAQAARVEEISAEEAGPMYQDPDTINRQPAPESGQLYTVVEPTKKASSRRKPPGAPAKTEAELAEMYSTPDKSRQREGVNYTDLSLPGSSAPPSSQGGVQYSQVRM